MDGLIKKNIVANFLTQAITFIVPLILSIYTSRVFNVTLIGKLSYINSILTYFTIIAEFGVTTYGIFKISEARNSKEDESARFWELFLIKLTTSTISLLLYFILIIYYGSYRDLLSIGIISLVASATNVTWYYQGKEKFREVAVVTLVSKIVELLIVLLFIKSEKDFLLYAVITYCTVLIPNLVLLIPVILKMRKPKHVSLKSHLKPVSQMFFSAMLVSVYSVMDKSMIKWLIQSEDEVGYYEQALRVYNIASIMVTITSQVLSPRVTAVKDKGLKAIHDLYNVGFRFVYMFSLPILVGLFVLANPIINTLFGPGYDKSVPILQAFSLLPIIVGFGRLACYLFINPFYKQKFSIYATIAGASTNLVLNVVLCLQFGAFGTAIATVISELIVCIMNILYFNYYIKISKFLITFPKYLIASVIMGVFSLIFSRYACVDSLILKTFLNITLSAVVYFGFLVFIKEPILTNISKKIVSMKKVV